MEKLSLKKALAKEINLTPVKAKTGTGKIMNSILFIRDDQPSFFLKQSTEFN